MISEEISLKNTFSESILKLKIKSKTEMIATVQENKSKHTRGSNKCYLIRTRQNNVHIFGKFCFGQSHERNRYKTWNVVNTDLNVTFDDRFSNAPTLAKIEFGNDENEKNGHVLHLGVLHGVVPGGLVAGCRSLDPTGMSRMLVSRLYHHVCDHWWLIENLKKTPVG